MTGSGPIPDLEPAARALRTLTRRVTDEHMRAPTPCQGWTVGDLLDHIMGLTVAFYAAATKARDVAPSGAPPPRAANLDPGWRVELPRRLNTLIAAWRDPAAWSGQAVVAGVTLPSAVMGVIALDELVIHGWDLARAIGVPYQVDQRTLETVYGMVSQQQTGEGTPGLFGPTISMPADAPLLDRVVGLTGRDPGWKP